MILVLGIPLILTTIFAVGKYKHTCRKHRQKLEGMKSMGKEGNKNMKDKDGQGGEEEQGGQGDEEEGQGGQGGEEEGQGGKEGGEEEPEPEPEKFSGINNKKNNRIDYAATVEDAYSDLSKVLGGDGIKNLTSDTQKLMKQQLQLAEAMQSMTPLLEQAKSLIGGFDMKNFDGIASLAKNLNMPVPGQ
jgi:hypothetical protein